MYTILFDREDNWQEKEAGYNVRYLDALARIFGINRPCAAVSIQPGDPLRYHISFNKDLVEGTINYQKFRAIEHSISENNLPKLVVLYLLTNAYASPKVAILDVGNIIPTTIANLDDVRCEAIWQNYLQYITQPIDEDFSDLKFKLSIRAYQDAVKLTHHFANQQMQIPVPQIQQNPNNFHAELVDDHIGEYFGVSLLCCAPCHIILEERNVDHRGTHGVIEPNWRHTIGGYNTLESISGRPTQQFDGRILQQHDLSDDEDLEKLSPDFRNVKIDQIGEILNVQLDFID